MEPVLLFDTTLRDGTQGENINFSVKDKIRIARQLDEIGIHYIEGGWPGSNPKDKTFFEMAKEISFSHAKLTAFGSTRKPETPVDADPNLKDILDADTPCVCIFGKSWDLHVRILGTSLQENLAMIRESVAHLKSHDREVVYDAEHFFDGYKDNPEYAVQTLESACFGGADFIVLCDTNGGTLPDEIVSIVHAVKHRVPVKLGIHAHNDCGLAVANTVLAVQNGAVMVHGTVNGYGERCGNADLTTIIPLLSVKMERDCISKDSLARMQRLSRFVSETANMIPQHNRPFVGKSAFAHKGGIHVSAVMKNPRAYEHMDPRLVGNERRVLVSDLSGKSNIEYKAKEHGVELGKNGVDSKTIVSRIKRMEKEGYQFDVADGSFKLLMEKLTDQFMPRFELESFRVVIEKNRDEPCSSHATIKISVGDSQEITAAEGDGPVSALDNALRKALDKFFPEIETMHLVDFKVRVIDGREGTAAKVRVLIESRDKDQFWSTIGVSDDIIEASWQALADSFHLKLNLESEEEEGAAGVRHAFVQNG